MSSQAIQPMSGSVDHTKVHTPYDLLHLCFHNVQVYDIERGGWNQAHLVKGEVTILN